MMSTMAATGVACVDIRLLQAVFLYELSNLIGLQLDESAFEILATRDEARICAVGGEVEDDG